MLIKTRLRNTAVKALCESMTVKLMVELSRELMPNYDLHRRLRLRESISIPVANAARQIVDDLCSSQQFPAFVQLLIDTQYRGFKGRKYPVSYLPRIIRELELHGYVFDRENNMFIENSQVRTSINWGVLREGVDYEITFLRFDIAGNSNIVRANAAKKVEKAYQDFFSIVNAAVARRNGRLWSLEGDGGLAAFAFSGKDTAAALCAVECLHELFIYNRTRRVIAAPLAVRFALHAGRHVFSGDTESLKKSDPVKETLEIESRFTRPGSCSASNKVLISVDKRIGDLFAPVKAKNSHGLACYGVEAG